MKPAPASVRKRQALNRHNELNVVWSLTRSDLQVRIPMPQPGTPIPG
jgi:hypothetical protein